VSPREIKDQKVKVKIAESPRCGDDFLNLALCFLHFDFFWSPGGSVKAVGLGDGLPRRDRAQNFASAGVVVALAVEC